MSRERPFVAAFGTLYLTDQRLIFCPYLYTLSWSPVIVDIAEIDGIGEATMPWYRNLAFLFVRTAWYLTVGKSRYFFTSLSESERDGWLRTISSVANVPIGQSHAV